MSVVDVICIFFAGVMAAVYWVNTHGKRIITKKCPCISTTLHKDKSIAGSS